MLISLLALGTLLFQRPTYAQQLESGPIPGTVMCHKNIGPNGERAIDATVCNLPVADAGQDVEVKEGETITLDASGSYDKDGTIKSHSWEVLDSDDDCREIGHLTSDSEKTVEFDASQVSKDCSISYLLTVTDNDGLTNTSQVRITVLDTTVIMPPNQNPIAVAGEDQDVKSGDSVKIDGTGS